ncbi:MAG: maleate cis-trans isomerase family protein [Desulfitobacteriia bacterium]|jgi:maleate isomerase
MEGSGKKSMVTGKVRVGLIMPALQVVTEPLYYEIAGKECEFFTTRLYLDGTNVENYIKMEKMLPRAIQELASAEVDIIAYCCTASGAILGYEEEQHNCRLVEEQTKIPMTTTMVAVVDALKFLQAKRIVLLSPYIQVVNKVEVDFFEKNGFEIAKDAGQGIVDGSAISRVTPAEITKFALENWDETADAMFLSCMNWHAISSVAEIEQKIGKPVITSHSATLWKVLNMMGKNLRSPQNGKWLFG